MNTIEKLNRIADLKSGIALVESDKQALIDSILTPEIKAKLAEIDAEFAGKTESLNQEMAFLEGEVKQEVVSGGATVKGTFLMAVFNKGRVSWDTKALDGYATAHPEIEQFRKVGEPSVSIRGI